MADDVPLCAVCDDVRYANEATAVRALGGRAVMLLRRGAGSKSGFGYQGVF
ncbi:hypothetical protein [Bosea sp. Tri-49]|uniref:hypothetical protein n=1 Tax=Bosea sp. Tri-49 TaxID=1867715 RepID=UPI0019D11448|nr:hypothetical protein [Bosea sp. Tri-49]